MKPNCAEVVDVGQCRAGDDQVAKAGEEPVTIIIREQRLSVQIACGGTRERIRRENRTGIVFGAIHAVGIAGHRIHATLAVERHRQCEQKFRVAATASFASDGHRRFAAGQQHARCGKRLPMTQDLTRDPGMHDGDLA